MSLKKAKVIERAEILIPNAQHKSFSGTNKFIEAGTNITGLPVAIPGLRKGKAFDYRLFKTKNNYIYLNKIKMENTEVTLGMDSQNSENPTVINVSPAASAVNRDRVIGAVLGAAAGFAYAKHKKHDHKKAVMFAVGGAVIGYAVGMFIQHRKAIVIKPSKSK